MRNRKLLLTLIALIVTVCAVCAFVSCTAEPKIDHIEIYSSPKTSYVLGEELDLADASILVVYVDNSERKISVTSDMVSSYSADTLGDQYILISYEGVSVTFKVTVSRPEVTSVNLSIPDDNVNYVVEQQLNLDNCYMIIGFSDGTHLDIPITREMCSGYDRDELGLQEVKVTYNLDGTDYSATYNVTVDDRELVGIDMHTVPTQTVYYLGDSELDLTGGVITLKYNNGYTHTESMTTADGTLLEGLTYEFDSTQVASSIFATVSYQGFTTEFNVKIANRDVSSYEVLNYEEQNVAHPKYQYLDLNLDGLKIYVTYTNGSGEEITIPSEKVKFSGYDSTISGAQTVNIEFYYGEVRLDTLGSLDIDVIPREATGLTVKTEGSVYQNTEFDLVNWQIALVYNNGEESEPFALQSQYIDWKGGIEMDYYENAGEQEWVIKYNDLTLNYKFNVIALEITGVEFEYSGSIIAYVGGDIDTSGITVNVTYNSRAKKEGLSMDGATVEFDNGTAGSATAKVKYVDENNLSFTVEEAFTVTVVKKISKVEVSDDVQTDYVINNDLNLTNLKLSITYDNDIYPSSEVDYDKLKANGWSTIVVDSKGNETDTNFSATGTYYVYFVHNGLAEGVEPYIQIEVTNKFQGIEGVFYSDGEEKREADLGSVAEGNEIDLEGYYIRVKFQGGCKDYPITAEMLDYNSKNTVTGRRDVTIYYPSRENYWGFITTSVEVVAKVASGIVIKQNPTQMTYVSKGSGLTFNYSGMIIWLEYNNGTYKVIDIEQDVADNKLQFVGLDSEVGEQTVEVRYNHSAESSFTADIIVNVVSSSVSEISWNSGSNPTATAPAGTKFDINSFAINDASGGLVRLGTLAVDVKETNGNTRSAALSEYADGFIVSGYAPNASGLQYVKLFYGTEEEKATLTDAERDARTLTVVVTVGDRQLKSIALEANTDDAFVVIQGAPIDVSLFMLRLTFTDGSYTLIPLKSEYINKSESNLGGYDVNDFTVEDARTVTVSYTYGTETEPKTVDVNFKIVEKSLVKIDINDLPKRKYIELEEFDREDGTVMLYYDNGTSEIKRMSEATIGDSSSTFNIDISNFHNEEFDGKVKEQRIEITYSYYGKKFNTSYVIYMRNRKDISIEYNKDNIYDFVYGQVTAPAVTVKGYANYDATDMTEEFSRITPENSKGYVVEYIPQNIWLSVRREAGVDYTLVPVDAGEYRIVVSYAGDGIHNACEDATHMLTIAKKKIYIGFASGQSKVYGQDMPEIMMIFGKELDANGAIVALENPLSVFIEGDGLYSANFNTEYNKKYATVAILADNAGNAYLIDNSRIELDMFDIVYLNKSNEEVTLNAGTSAGLYSINVKNSVIGKNYSIELVRGAFTVDKRPVKIVPHSSTYEYGLSSAPAIGFDWYSIDGQPESGLYGTDTIKGNLSRDNLEINTVGSYAINIGSLVSDNPNYDIKFENPDGACVTITKRVIYVKTETDSKIYGEEMEEPGVRFYGNSECTDEDSAFAFGDDLSSLGNLTYWYAPVDDTNYISGIPGKYTVAGKYNVTVQIDESGDKASNYHINYVGGVINVEKRPVIVTAHETSKVYGSADPVIEYTVSAREGDPKSGLIANAEGVLDTLDGALGRVEGEDAGSYNILIGELKSNNYNITFVTVNAEFKIVRKSLYVSISQDALTKVYDGKKPEIAEYQLLENIDGAYSSYPQAEDVNDFINFTFDGLSKDAGSYPVKVTISNNNYAISFVNGESYVYVITKRLVSITVDNYVGLPDGLEYSGQDYVFSAHIGAEDLQYAYNDDGTVKTDENNRPLYDDDTVSLSRSVVRDAGTYTTYVIDITDKNYELDSANSPEITFTVKPHTVYIAIKCNSETEEHTFEREYNNQSATLTAGDYDIENTIAGEKTPYFTLGIYSGDTAVTAKDVRYADDGVTVVGYEIRIAENSPDPNYVVALKEAYRFKIVPRAVQIRINDQYLSKVYDGEEPSIASTMFTLAVATTGFDSATVSFMFERSGNDDNDNTAVGTYDITISCSDRNFDVTTEKNYVYTINRSLINVTISASALSKVYDGKDFQIEYGKLTLSSYYGITPIVHNFASGATVAGYTGNAFDVFKKKLENLTQKYKDLKKAVEAVTFGSGASNASNKLDAVKTALTLFESAVGNSSVNCFTAENTTIVRSAIDAMEDSLNSAMTAIEEGELNRAETIFKNVTDKFAVIKDVVTQENSYIAFVYGDATTTATVDKGEYAITMYYADYNREFKLLTSSPKAEVKEHGLRIIVDTNTVPYGTSKDSLNIAYRIWDSSNGVDVTDDLSIKALITGSPVLDTSETVLKAGTYPINLSGMSVSNANYKLDVSTSSKVTVTKATLTIKMNDISDPSKFVYNGKISQSDIFNHAGEYTYVSGLAGGDTVDELADIIRGGASLRCHCYIDDSNTVEIFNVDGFSAGEYAWTVTGYTADNYYIVVEPGILTVAKAKIYASGLSDVLSKTYGDTTVSFYYGLTDTQNIKVYRDSDTDKANGINISEVVWAHTYSTDIDPMSAEANAGDTVYEVSFSSDGYYMVNYEVVFEPSYQVQVVRAELTMTLKSTAAGSNSVITAKYMATPQAYTYSYEGFKNGDTAEDLGLQRNGKNAPVINFKSNGAYRGVATYTIFGDSDAVDISKANANVTNYKITVQDFSFKVEARKIYVSLQDVDRVLTPLTGGAVTIEPYVLEITNTTEVNSGEETIYVPTEGRIIRGNYGTANFVFEAEISDDEMSDAGLTSAINAYIQNALKNIRLCSSNATDTYYYVLSSGDKGRNIEYYKGSELYAHSVRVVSTSTYDKGYITAKLSGMMFTTTEQGKSTENNVVFDYKEFEVPIQREIRSVSARWTEKLLASDITDISNVKSKLNVFVDIYNGPGNSGFNVDGNDSNVVIDGLTLDNGTSAIGIGKTGYITVKYAIACNLFDRMSSDSLKYTINYVQTTTAGSTERTQSVYVTDARENSYNSTAIASLAFEVPTRFYQSSTTSVSDPEISGLTYGKINNATGESTFVSTTGQYTYDGIRMRVRLVETIGTNKFTIGLAGDVSGQYALTMTFDRSDLSHAVITLYRVSGGSLTELSTANYSIDCTKLFDGYSHDLRVKLDKETLSLIVSIDGTSGSYLEVSGMSGMASARTYLVGTSSGDHRFYLSSTMKYAIGSLDLTEQGLYESSGTFIDIPKNANGTITVNTTDAFFTTTARALNNFFGLPYNLGKAFTTVYYVDGVRVDNPSSVTLGRGSHMIELALYYNEVLFDTDYIVVMVAQNVQSKVLDYSNNSYSSATAGSVLNMYDPKDGKDLITSDAGAQKKFLLYASSASEEFYAPAYYSHTFTLDRVATSGVNDYYDEGTYYLYYNLFAEGGYSSNNISLLDTTSADYAMKVGNLDVRGARLRFERVQSARDTVSSGNINYVYNVYLDVRYAGSDGTLTTATKTIYENIAGSANGVGFEVRAYYDKLGATGNGAHKIRLRQVGTTTWTIVDLDAIGDIGDALPFIQLTGNATRVTNNKVLFVENEHAYNDYLVDGEYTMYNGRAITLNAGSTLKLADGVGTERYSAYNNINFEFEAKSAQGTVQMVLAENTIDNEENRDNGSLYGAYLYYDLKANTLTFKFRWGYAYSLAQTYTLQNTTSGVGKHVIEVDFNMDETDKKYVGGDSDLVRNGVTLTSPGSAKLYYHRIDVTIDGESTVFYTPRYADMNGWYMENGSSGSRDSNKYSDIGDYDAPPTFIALYNYNSVTYTDDSATALTIYKYSVAMKDSGAYTQRALEAETPLV